MVRTAKTTTTTTTPSNGSSTDQNNAGSTLGALGIAPPPSGGPTNQPKPFGIPPTGYKPPTVPKPSSYRRPPGSGPLPPTIGGTPNPNPYVPGDEWGPSQDLQMVPTIQAELVAAGLLKASDVRPGVWDAASADAYTQVLAFANQQGITATDALTVLTSNPPLGKNALGVAQPTVTYTNPQDVQTQYQNVSQQLTGQEQDPAAFVQQYHDLEAAQHHAAGSDYTQAPSLTGAATQYIQKNMPGQEMSYGVASRMQDFFSMLSGTGA